MVFKFGFGCASIVISFIVELSTNDLGKSQLQSHPDCFNDSYRTRQLES